MQANYRSDYAGEFVVLETRWSGGKKEQVREFVANPIENHHISGRSACIASDVDSHKFNFRILQRHRGGLLGSKKLQTYGTGLIAKNMRLDFTVETSQSGLDDLMSTAYHDQNIVYTSVRSCVANPGLFYLIPYNPRLHDLASIVYLAAFDGHKEIFLLGYNRETPLEAQDWHLQIKQIVDTYSATKFYFVGEKTNMHQDWFDSPNAESMDYRTFISYCDI
jgi:hypothetical protein